MAKVKVYVIPKSRDGPATEFCTDDAHNVRELHHLLTQAFGIGCLFGPNNLCLCPDLTLKLEDGEYKYYESHLEYKNFPQASVEDARSAIQQEDYMVLDGHVIAPMPLPPASTPEWGPFYLWESSRNPVACKALAEHHKLQLQRMGTMMSEGGYKVLELHNMKNLLELTDGDLCYKGTIDYAVVPCAVSMTDAKWNIRVAFMHHKAKDHQDISTQLSKIYLAKNIHNPQSRSKESCNASRLREYHPRAIMALYAMVFESSAPLDLVVTDGITFDLFRFREDKSVLIYHDLSGTEAYFALSEGLQEDSKYMDMSD